MAANNTIYGDFVDKRAIEQEARALQGFIWDNQDALWPDKVPGKLEMLSPRVAAHVLGVRYEEPPSLGGFGQGGARYEVAGFYDRHQQLICVASRFKPQVVRFTGAHEIGHWVMHPDTTRHRDRPVAGLLDHTGRDPKEAEADYFAACYLMPRGLIREAFAHRFGRVPFVFDELTAFRMSPDDPDALLRPVAGSRARAAALAGARSAGGHVSLAEQFKVSVKSMAIRLEELNLVECA